MLVSWYTDFTSSKVYCLNDDIVLVDSSNSLIIIFSPGINFPEVCDKIICVPVTVALTNPVAPLLAPLTKELMFAVNAVFNVRYVYVWTSNKCKFHWLLLSTYGVFLNPNEYTLAFPISYPPPSPPTAEGGASGESEMVIGSVTMSPKTLGAFTDVTRQLMIQSSLDLNTSTFLFTKLGSTEAANDSSSGAMNLSIATRFIDTIMQVQGVTTGYRIDVPVRFVKKQ